MRAHAALLLTVGLPLAVGVLAQLPKPNPIKAGGLSPIVGITRANCERLRRGMAVAQVEALFGKSARRAWDYRDCPVPGVDPRFKSWLGKWKGSEVDVTVWFNSEDKVDEAFWESPSSGLLTPMVR